MTLGPGLMARVALFAALVYVLSWATWTIPNLNLSFFVVFTAGYLWGVVPGMLVGAVGMALWTWFNPYGPAPIPIMLAQIIGMASGGVLGHVAAGLGLARKERPARIGWLCLFGALATLCFFTPVSVVDAWLFQPFWPRLVTSMAWSLISLVSNVLVFPLLFVVTARLYAKG